MPYPLPYPLPDVPRAAAVEWLRGKLGPFLHRCSGVAAQLNATRHERPSLSPDALLEETLHPLMTSDEPRRLMLQLLSWLAHDEKAVGDWRVRQALGGCFPLEGSASFGVAVSRADAMRDFFPAVVDAHFSRPRTHGLSGGH